MTDTFQRIPPSQFGLVEFAELNPGYFQEYIEYRLNGYHPTVAFRRVWGDDQLSHNGHLKVEEIEHNPYVRRALARAISNTPVDKVWDDKKAVNELLNLARNVFANESVRLGAIKELNVLCGITVTDDKGKTKRGLTLDEFYRSTPKPGSASEGDGPDMQPHIASPTTH